MQSRNLRIWIQLMCLLTLVGCGGDLGPQPPAEPLFAFTPAGRQVSLALGQFVEFKVSSDVTPDFDVDWLLNRQGVALGPRYRFTGVANRADTLTAIATHEDIVVKRRWIIATGLDSTTVVTFAPAEQLFEVNVGDTLGFHIATDRPHLTGYRWELDGQVISRDSVLVVTPSLPGEQTLTAVAITPRYTRSQSWELHAFALGDAAPRPPRDLAVIGGEGVASIVPSWRRAIPRSSPIVAYEIGISYDGPLTGANWGEAAVVVQVPAPAGVEWLNALVPGTQPGVVPGAHAWVAVATVDGNGLRSDLPPNQEIDISEPWWVTGRVADETGAPVPGILVHEGRMSVTARTDSAGRYRVGPFNSQLPLELRTATPNEFSAEDPDEAWFDAVSGPLAFGVREEWDFLIIRRTRLESACSSYNQDFLTFLRALTRTTWPTQNRDNLKLYKWDSYPVSVWIPAYRSPAGLDLQALCLATIDWWNQAMGEQYLTLADDAASAQIIYRFGNDGPNYYGRTSVLLPGGLFMGDVIPERVEVFVSHDLITAQNVQEISLHELGHALGMSGHAGCANGGYLMYISALGILSQGWENAIKPDEKRALATLRILPQGFDMGGFISAP